ncbi:hypothetical protein JUN65_05965 [Gluconacetobacter azotocaptans]|jgi:pimeloyl-ACP methyl ester carboxylesterase|uniref:hypothetical protein n=1 Tax=Gluconacetobacter azotocaptans TaxID=142834 RepID=UPI00195C3A90|nr:hypothetical protein [Gluconacetobacter azotocaptans]MBM9401127.1 hypothetical protein [Gluconacetobacter azotocaptans]
MCSYNGADFLVPYDFYPGEMTDAPVLLPLPDANGNVSTMVQFCRRICPGASILVPRFDRLHAGRVPTSDATADILADRAAALIVHAVSEHDLALVPIVSVGHRDGADLGMCLTLRHGTLLAASIMLSPTTYSAPAEHQTIKGLHVLLTLGTTEHDQGAVGWQTRNAMLEAGAEIICERIPRRRTLGPFETAISRVFIAALFGNHQSEHEPEFQFRPM